MRWFIVFLLIANILLFFWVQQEALRPSPHSDIPPPEIGKLRLLKESPVAGGAAIPGPATPTDDVDAVASDAPVEAAVPDAPVEAALADQGADAPQAVTPKAESAADVVPVAPMPAEELPETPDLAGADSAPEVAEMGPVDEPPAEPMTAAESPETPALAEADGASEVVDMEPAVEPEVPQTAVAQDDGPASESEPVVAPPLPGPVEEVAPVVQEEMTEPLVVEASPEAPLAVAAEAEFPKPAVCARVGPFEPADADALLQKLPSNFELLSDSSEEQTIDDGYYVLLPALQDRATGLSKLQELNEAGFEDTWLFRRGAYRNAISLGLFRRQGSAKRHASKVAAKGFDVEVRPRKVTAERRWLQLRHAGEVDMQGALPLPDGVTLTPQACP